MHIYTSMCVCICKNGSKINTHQCKSKICKMKDNLIVRDLLVNTTATRFHVCLVPPGTIFVH